MVGKEVEHDGKGLGGRGAGLLHFHLEWSGIAPA